MTKIDTINNKLKDKFYKGHMKPCLRKENHANCMANEYKYDKVIVKFGWLVAKIEFPC